MSDKQPTKGTEIAALEARRNEQQVLAEGALLGERRAAFARLAMIAMFGIISNVRPEGTSFAMTAAGAVYTALALVTIWILHRIKVADPGKARVRPLAVSIVDFSFITVEGCLDFEHGGYDRGMAAIAAAVVLSFAVARWPLYNVLLPIVAAPVSFLIVVGYAHQLDDQASFFIAGGLLVVTLLWFGLAMLIVTLARGGGPLAVGVLFGLLFIALGSARLYLSMRG